MVCIEVFHAAAPPCVLVAGVGIHVLEQFLFGSNSVEHSMHTTSGGLEESVDVHVRHMMSAASSAAPVHRKCEGQILGGGVVGQQQQLKILQITSDACNLTMDVHPLEEVHTSPQNEHLEIVAVLPDGVRYTTMKTKLDNKECGPIDTKEFLKLVAKTSPRPVLYVFIVFPTMWYACAITMVRARLRPRPT